MERPIIFSGPMIRALLAGQKTQTRRLVQATKATRWLLEGDWKDEYVLDPGNLLVEKCPHGRAGDRLWVREAFRTVPAAAYRASREEDGSLVPHRVSPDNQEWAIYREGWTRSAGWAWRPSIHMPRWASRITLEITDVRVERLRSISEGDARSEGVEPLLSELCSSGDYRASFSALWDELNGKRAPWSDDPFVWVLTFRRTEEGTGC